MAVAAPRLAESRFPEKLVKSNVPKPSSKAALLLALQLLLCLAGFEWQAGAAPSPEEPSALAKRFIEHLAKQDFAAGFAQFDSAMKAALPAQTLAETWKRLQSQAGTFEAQLQTRSEKQMGYDVVFVTCKFAKTKLDAKVVFESNGEIAGLFFLPTPAAEVTTLPIYVNTNAFHEKDFTVGTGQWRLPGTLSMPAGSDGPARPALVLVQGSGPNDRDETVGQNKPFRDLAWGLASRGIAVLRYEKRTREYAARLMALSFTNLTVREETIDDAVSAVKQLRSTPGIDAKRVFILGHSLGAALAPRIAQADPQIAGLILLAGPTRPLEDLIVEQTRYLLSLEPTRSAAEEAQLQALSTQASEIKRLTPADASSSKLLMGAPPSYWLDLREHNVVVIAKGVKAPMLILQAGRDYQVTGADFAAWKEALGSRTDVAFKFYPDLNHLFMAGEGKSSPAEYARPGHVSEEVIKDIADWILKIKTD